MSAATSISAAWRNMVNAQVKRNLDRFPSDFVFQLTQAEVDSLRSHIATLNELDNRPHFATGSEGNLKSHFATSSLGHRQGGHDHLHRFAGWGRAEVRDCDHGTGGQ